MHTQIFIVYLLVCNVVPAPLSEESVSKSLLPLILNHFPFSTVLVSHDYQVLPNGLISLLRNMNSTYVISSTTAKVPTLQMAVPAKQRGNHDNCHLIISTERKLKEVVSLSRQMGPFRQEHDYFVFWDREGGNTSRFFFAPSVRRIKFKLGLDQDTSFTTHCLYCKEKDAVAKLERNLFPDFTWDFGGQLLRFPYFDHVSMEMVDQLRSQGLSGDALYELVYCMGRTLNFNWTIDFCSSCKPDGSYSNATRNGIVEDLLSGRGDCAVGIATTQDRWTMLDFTAPINSGELTFATAQPQCRFRWENLLRPFKVKIWCLLTASVLCYTLITYMILRMSDGLTNNGLNHWTAMDRSVMGTIRSLLQQDITIPKSERKCPLLIATWYCLTLIVCNSYKSLLVGYLILPPQDPVLNSFEALAASDMQVGIVSVSWALLNKTIGQIHPEVLIFPKWDSCYEAAISSGIACITDTTLFEEQGSRYVDRHGNRLLRVASETKFPMWGALAAPKGAPFIGTFERVIFRLQQGALFAFWERRFSEETAALGRRTAAANTTEERPLAKFTLPFLILLSGWTAAILTFVASICYAGHKAPAQLQNIIWNN